MPTNILVLLLICGTAISTTPDNCDGHKEGDSWEEVPCMTCNCWSGEKVCALPSCVVECRDYIPGEGVCCPTCPNGPDTYTAPWATVPPPVSYTLPPPVLYTVPPIIIPPPDCDGYEEGDKWKLSECERCSCILGRKLCISLFCDSLRRCENPVCDKDAGCLTCPLEIVPPPEFEVHPCDGYEEGAQWKESRCVWCSCRGGEKSCIATACRVECTNPVYEEDACCPTCPDGNNLFFTFPPPITAPPPVTIPPPDCEGYAEGDKWEPSSCERCSCELGIKSCANLTCEPIQCKKPVLEEGACCPTCPVETECQNVKKCNRRSYWDEKTCKCVCTPVECPAGHTLNAKSCRCRCKRQKCPKGFYFDKNGCECKSDGSVQV